MPKERTFSIIKPDATRRNLIGKIITKLEDGGLCIIAQKKLDKNKNIQDIKSFCEKEINKKLNK